MADGTFVFDGLKRFVPLPCVRTYTRQFRGEYDIVQHERDKVDDAVFKMWASRIMQSCTPMTRHFVFYIEHLNDTVLVNYQPSEKQLPFRTVNNQLHW